jgi:hypothetical protein
MGGRGSGRIAAENEWVDKPWWYLIAFDYQIFSFGNQGFLEFQSEGKNIKDTMSVLDPIGFQYR